MLQTVTDVLPANKQLTLYIYIYLVVSDNSPVRGFFFSLILSVPPPIISAVSIAVVANADIVGGGSGNGSPVMGPISEVLSISFSLLPHHPGDWRGGIGIGKVESLEKGIFDVKAAAAIAATKRVLNSEAKLGMENGTAVGDVISFFVVSCVARFCGRGPRR